ncbi:hypothetical protein EAM_1790 [unidentified phage]|nr:hypothetical protein EAM_1790 [Erwinia amylovora ATCC 49946]
MYKGSKKGLSANDLMAGTPFNCILEQSKTFFTVLNLSSAYNDQINLIFRLGSSPGSLRTKIRISYSPVQRGKILVRTARSVWPALTVVTL